MPSYSAKRAAEQYRQLGLRGQVEGADPHRLIQLLYEGALTALAAALRAMEAGQPARKGEQIGRAIDIIGGLRASLDDSAGELAGQLDSLYDYCNRRLLTASRDNDPRGVEEVTRLIETLQSGWNGIAPAAKP